ncbi:hypothetical protein LH51_05750 [Nitrincola sp. A-D6]|uniref:hypothetical protein n=1 Tax=Nitrincola sp. A-D6 TaxID=1545442 RepID=UPI00051FE020|nr:hypothetical protein [Nitrincola sp. A-D6]KGK42625.1 hypothetical protein LH51_05750 [Nitrincola sp. A-D6]
MLIKSWFCVALLLASSLVFADPFDGFFSGGKLQVSQQQASQFIQDISGNAESDPELLLTTLINAFNWRAAAIRVYGDDWFAAEQDTRSDWQQTMKNHLQDKLLAGGVTALEVVRVEEIQAGSEFRVGTLLLPSGDSLQWEWILRAKGSGLEILDLQQTGQSLLKAVPVSE